MRLVTCAVFLTFAAGIAEACSAFIPFDEYAGPPVPGRDGGQDGASPDDGGARPPPDGACTNADLKTDPNHCGACDRPCACDAGRCPVEIVNEGSSNVTAVDIGVRNPDGGGEAIYFVRAAGTLARVDPDGGRYEEALGQAAAPLSVGGLDGISASRTDAITLFTRDRFTDASPTQIVPPRHGLGPVLYETNVFWSDDDGMFYAKPRPDAGVSQLSDASAVAITSAAGASYWTDDTGLVLRTSTRVPDSLVEVLRAGLSGVTGIAVGAKHIYLSQRGQGLVVYDYDGTTAKLLRRVSVDDPELVVADAAHVYVYDAAPTTGHRRLLRYELDGTGQLVLEDTLGMVRGLAVDAAYLYVADQTKLSRIVK